MSTPSEVPWNCRPISSHEAEIARLREENKYFRRENIQCVDLYENIKAENEAQESES